MRTKQYIVYFFMFCSQFLIGQSKQEGSLKFTQNQGQINDFEGRLRPDVLFTTNVTGMNIFLRETGMSYLFCDYKVYDKKIHEQIDSFKKNHSDEAQIIDFENKLRNETELSFHQLDVDFMGMNSDVQVFSEKKASDYLNYYSHSHPDGLLNVPLYNLVKFKNVYNGIDVEFYGNEKGMEYDFRIAAHSDPTQIKLLWKGSEGVEVNKEGRLVIKTSLNEITESIPEAYQIIEGVKRLVNVSYSLTQVPDSDHVIVSFDIKKYDSNYELVVDPWVTYYGGSAYDRGNDLFNDSFGNLYVVGYTISTNAIATAGSFKSTLVVSGFTQEGFLAKFSPAGVRLWATYYGGAFLDIIQSVTVDKNDFVYVVGYTQSDTGIATSGIHKSAITPSSTSAISYDAFIAKFSPTGSRVWGTYYGGGNSDFGYEVVTDTSGNVYMVGRTSSPTGISTTGSSQKWLSISATGTYGLDAFLAKFSSTGNLIWGTYYGGRNSEQGYGVGIDRNNNVFICGSTNSPTGISTMGTFKPAISFNPFGNPTTDAFLAKFNAAGARQWGTYFGGEGTDIGNSLAVDTSDNIYVSGRTSGSTGISSSGSFQVSPGGGQDAFLAKFNQSGGRIWSTYYGGSRSDYSYAAAVNKTTNNVMISGDTYSTNLPVSPCAIQTSLIGLENGFIGQFYPNGSIYCSSYFGNNHEEDTKITSFGCYIYLTGYSPSGVSTTPGAHQTSSGGSTDGWIAQLLTNTCGTSTPIKSLPFSKQDNSSICKPCNGSATVSINSNCLSDSLYTYNWNNLFTTVNTTDTFNTVNNLCAGNYWVEVLIQNSCFETRDTVFFTIADSIDLVMNFAGDSVCFGFPNNFVNTSLNEPIGTSYFWDFGDGNSSTAINPSHTYSSPGSYKVTFMQQYSPLCFDTLTMDVVVYEKPIASFGTILNENEYFSDNLDSVCSYLFEEVSFADYSTVSLSYNITNFDWQFGSESSSIDQYPTYAFQSIRNHVVTFVVSTEEGCKDTAQTVIKVCDDFNFNIPNSFTPNGDGINDGFTHYGFGISSEDYLFEIYNRWGEKIFETNKIEAWDGTHNGQKVSDGVYVWKVRYKRINGQGLTEKMGHVTLIRKKQN